MHTVTYLEAVNEALIEEMERDKSVFLMGEDVTWNLMGATDGLAEKFGTERVRDTPISEAGFVGAGAGAAMVGMRPIVHMLIAPFLYVAFDQLVSIVAKSTYLYGGQAKMPITIMAPMVYNAGNAAQHSDRPYSTLMTIPGLKIIAPTTAYDAKGMLKAAIRDDDPVVSFEDASLWAQQGEIPDEDYVVPLGVADVKREGSDVTVVGIAGAVGHALAAADELAGDGVSVEVVDLRSIVPLDRETVLASVAKTGRLVVADPAHEMGSVASEVSAVVAQEGFWDLQAPIVRVTTPHTHIPYSADLERPLYPSADRIAAAARQLMG
ncbi:MAG: alpha-ketoacid dehydrogenase subunit beta [Acidimicrobiia bacterium]